MARRAERHGATALAHAIAARCALVAVGAVVAACATVAGGALAAGCTCGAPEIAEPPPRRDEPARGDAISIRRGGREVRVRCALSCETARAELGRQQRACVADPTSTPHQVGGDAPAISLGCCTEAESAYRDACGVEGLESCASRWSAECASGRLGP